MCCIYTHPILIHRVSSRYTLYSSSCPNTKQGRSPKGPSPGRDTRNRDSGPRFVPKSHANQRPLWTEKFVGIKKKNWLVGGWGTPLKNDGVRQLGWWHSPNIHGKIKMMATKPPTREISADRWFSFFKVYIPESRKIMINKGLKKSVKYLKR